MRDGKKRIEMTKEQMEKRMNLADRARAERYYASLKDLTVGTQPPKWDSAEADEQLGPIWREAQEEMTSRAAAALAATPGPEPAKERKTK
jgi:hypothetical protein